MPPKAVTPDAEKPPVARNSGRNREAAQHALADAKTPADCKSVAKDALRAANEAADSGNKDFAKRAAAVALSAAEKAKDDELASKATAASSDQEPKSISSSIFSATWNSRGILYREPGRGLETASATHPKAAKIA